MAHRSINSSTYFILFLFQLYSLLFPPLSEIARLVFDFPFFILASPCCLGATAILLANGPHVLYLSVFQLFM